MDAPTCEGDAIRLSCEHAQAELERAQAELQSQTKSVVARWALKHPEATDEERRAALELLASGVDLHPPGVTPQFGGCSDCSCASALGCICISATSAGFSFCETFEIDGEYACTYAGACEAGPPPPPTGNPPSGIYDMFMNYEDLDGEVQHWKEQTKLLCAPYRP